MFPKGRISASFFPLNSAWHTTLRITHNMNCVTRRYCQVSSDYHWRFFNASWISKPYSQLILLLADPFTLVQFSSVAQSCPTLCDPINRSMPGLPVHHQLLEFTHSYALSRWCHPAISSSVVLFSSRPQSLPSMSQLFTSGGQSIGVSASTSVLPMNTQDWSPLGWTAWISLQSKGLSRVFANTTVQMHQFSNAQLSSQSNSHIHTWPLEKP